jgi:hypothetical protein
MPLRLDQGSTTTAGVWDPHAGRTIQLRKLQNCTHRVFRFLGLGGLDATPEANKILFLPAGKTDSVYLRQPYSFWEALLSIFERHVWTALSFSSIRIVILMACVSFTFRWDARFLYTNNIHRWDARFLYTNNIHLGTSLSCIYIYERSSFTTHRQRLTFTRASQAESSFTITVLSV